MKILKIGEFFLLNKVDQLRFLFSDHAYQLEDTLDLADQSKDV